MITLGNFFFKYRNFVFPLFFSLLAFGTKPISVGEHLEYLNYALGVTIALAGQIVRALTIGLAYIVRGGKNKKVYANVLVTNGIFGHCRNPLYLGNILIITGLGIVTHSILFYFFGIPLFIFMYMAIIKAEENYLTQRFGEEYLEYCRKVNRFMPDLSGIGKTIGSMKFNWSRLVVKEYGTTYTWITVMILLFIKNQYIQYGFEVSKPVIIKLCLLFVMVTFLYAVAWYLKKSKRLIGK